MAGANDFQTAFNNAINSGGGFSTNNGITTLTDKSGKTLGTYDRAGNLINNNAPTPKFNQDTTGPNWNGNVTSSPGVTNFGVTYHDPSGVVNLGGNQWEQGANKDFQQSGLNPNQQNNWMQSFINAHRQDGQAISSSDAVNNNWNFFGQDARPDTQDSYLLQGPTGLKSGQSTLMTDSGTGQAYYVANVNGQLMKGAVPDALSPEFGNNGQANMSVPSVWNPDGTLKSMGTGSIGAIPSSFGSFSNSRSSTSSNSMPSLFPAYASASNTLAKPNAPSPVNISPTLQTNTQAPTVTNMAGQQVPMAVDPNANNNNNNSMYLNPYWTQIQQQGHTSRELQKGENLTNALNQEAQLYNIQPNQVKVVNSGGKTYLQVPWQLAQNHAYTQSANEQAQQQQTQNVINTLTGNVQPNTSGIGNFMQAIGLGDPTSLGNLVSQQQAPIQQQIQFDQQQQQAEDKLLQTQLNDAINQQNSTSFQDWLKAREQVAARGLGNSGFLTDAMVRNQLNNEDKMQGIFNTAMDNQQKSDAAYQNDIMKQQAALEGITPESVQAQMIKDNSALLPYYAETLAQQQTNSDNAAKLLETELANMGQGINPLTGQIGPSESALNDAAKLALQQAGVTGLFNGSPTLQALTAGGWTIGPDGKLVQTQTAKNDSANLQLGYNKLALSQQVANWNQQDKVAQIQISQGNLDLARQNDAIRNQMTQESIDDTKTKNLLTAYYNAQTKDLSGMSAILAANGGAMPAQGSSDYTKYQSLFTDYQKASDAYNQTTQGYASNMGK